MTYRTDAAPIALLILLSVAGCATLGKREPAPANPPPSPKTEPIESAPTPRQGDVAPVRQASYQLPETPEAKPDADAPRPQRLLQPQDDRAADRLPRPHGAPVQPHL